ncbi:MAG: DMT family transporter [Patescibacteria group bacterium]|nr:DMT family transporter [Patescibacteria group bacterium]MBU2509355.1 DMT family transporter [Patescibacteria group bacterium]
MWFAFAALNAFFESLKDATGKCATQKFDARTCAWSQHFFAAILLLLVAGIATKLPKLDSTFWLATLGSLSINTVTSILYMRALKLSPLSLVAPIVTLTPVFLLITSPIINREFPTVLGTVGVLIAVVGTYLLSANKRKKGILEPLKYIWKESGARLMLIVAAMWSISAPLDKVAVLHSTPLWYVAIINTLLALVLFPLLARGSVRTVFTSVGMKRLAPIGIFFALSITFQMWAISLAFVPYVISIKRASGVFGVIWGKLFFKEAQIKERLLGALVILIGAVLVLLASV